MADQSATLHTVRYGVLPRERRKELFGLECSDQLEWRNWTPGTEYTKNLVLKNVSTNTLKLRYKQTASKAFSMDFPEPFKLRPGMSHPLKVVFRPLKLQQYSDHIEVFCNDGSFIILVEAYTPATHIEVPSQLDFGFVPTKEVVSLPLRVKNTGDIRVGVSWKLESPFSIEPQAASMQPGESAAFQVSFMPPEACSYNVNALCQLDSGISATVKIAGIGKFPYLSLEHSSVDFGNVLVGRSVERSFRFGNHSVVDAHFTVEHAEGAEDGVFIVSPMRGTLGADEYTMMRVVYTPRHTGTFSSETFVVGTVGGNRLTLNLRGNAVGPVVTFSASGFNFGNVPTGQATSRVLYIQNHSDVPVTYDFQLDPHDTFSISKPRGAIPAQATAHVTVSFKSTVPACYWKRVACLIKDTDPLAVDLLATCYDDKSRPPPLTQRHISSYLNRLATGGPPVETDPANLSVPPSPVPSYHSRPNSSGSDGLDAPLGTPAGPLGAALELGLQQPLVGPTGWDLFFEGQDPARALQLDREVLDFGTGSRLSASEYQSVTVTNNTTAKVLAFFSVPGWQDPITGQLMQVFQVFPESADIKPQSQATFRVAFRPPKDAQHYAQVLQLRAFVKSMRNFRLVPDSLVIPPWSTPLLACGNTFLHTNPEFAPKVELSHTSIAFPPCRPGERACQTLMIVNYGDTPASFAFQSAGLGALFAISPSNGLVPPKGHVLIGLRFTPQDAKPVTGKVVCMFNNTAMSAVEVKLHGSGHLPRLTFNVQGTLFFRPTCVGASSQRVLTVHNTSRVPVAFAWQLPPKLAEVVSVWPAAGVLRGNESTQVTWTFTPSKQKMYDHKVACLLMDPPAGASKGAGEAGELQLLLPSLQNKAAAAAAAAASAEEELELLGPGAPELSLQGTGTMSTLDKVHLSLVGEGTQGALALDPGSLDLGPIRVGHAVQRTIALVNQSDGVLRYKIDCGPEEGADGVPEPGAAPIEFTQQALSGVEPRPGLELWVDDTEGAIPARASKTITATLFPRFRKQYRLQVRCRTATVAPPGGAAAGLLPPAAAPGGRPLSGGSAAGRLPPLTKQRSFGTAAAAGLAMGGTAALPPLTADDSPDKWPAPAICPVIAFATFPTIIVSDVSLVGLPKSMVWNMFGVKELNRELRSPVTDLELELNRMEDKGTLTTNVAMRALRPFVFDFGTHALHDRACVVHVEVCNVTDLPVHWEIHSYDDPDLEMENWVEPSQPRNEEERARDFITEHKIFEIYPRSGVLHSNNERATVTLRYNPRASGLHQLPVFLSMHDGKRLHVQLRGETVIPPVQRLLLPVSSRVYTFAPVPIGESSPPLQTYLLRNGGPGVVSYSLDLTQLHRLVEENWGYEVLQLRSEATGTIEPLSLSPLNWVFSPLEAKVYSVEVPVTLADGALEVITLQGRGYHPDIPGAAEPLPGERERDWAQWDGFAPEPSTGLSSRLALLSQEMLSFGTTLPKGLVRRVVVVTNTSSYPLFFEWDLGIFSPAAPAVAGTGSAIQAGLQISPMSGRLEPGERCVVRLALEAGITPQLFEAEVRCRVAADEEAMYESAAAAVQQAASMADALDYTETGSVIEEVIVESPNRRKSKARAAARRRIPIHLYMTTAIRARIEALDEQFTRTLTALAHRGADNSGAPEIPEPQTLTITLSGRVLNPAQIKSGAYIPPHEVEAAQKLLEGAGWVPPTEVTFWEAVAAARAEAARTQQLQQPEGPAYSLEQAVDKLQAAFQSFSSRHTAAGQQQQQRGAQPGTAAEGGMEITFSAGQGPANVEVIRPPGDGEEAAAAQLPVEGEPDEGPDLASQQPQQPVNDYSAVFSSVWRPIPRPPTPPRPHSAPAPSAHVQATRAAVQVLQEMLAEVMDPARDPDVFGVWDTLVPERVPALAELVSELPEPLVAAAAAGSAAAAAAAEEGEEAPASSSGGSGSVEPTEAALHDKAFQVFAEYVLESVVYGLVAESAAGEWEPPPVEAQGGAKAESTVRLY